MEPKQPIVLNEGEKAELEEGQALYEMTKTRGFQVLKKRLEDLGFHSWIDPRDSNSKEEWMWKETIAWASANNASELLEWIAKSISQSEYLEKKKSGELKIRPMTI